MTKLQEHIHFIYYDTAPGKKINQEEAQIVVQLLSEQLRVPAPKVCFNSAGSYGHSYYSPRRKEIHIPKRHENLGIVVHEYVHHVVPGEKRGKRNLWHGPNFLTMFEKIFPIAEGLV